MDRLIKYFNSHVSNVTVMYSTPGEYLEALKSQNITWPVKYDDMFPYSDNPQDYWTGYFSSRASAKKQVRDGQAALHGAAKLYAQKVINPTVSDYEVSQVLNATSTMLDSMGVYQHHDAVSGTAK